MSNHLESGTEKELETVSSSPVTGELRDQDGNDMYRMGKPQQFKRIFRLSTMIMFTSLLQGTWETVLLANTSGLINGGLAGLFWSYIWTFCGFLTIVASLAEMSSMAPTSGGQYHWVSEFAPRKYQRFLSYFSGWMATLSWQAGTAGASFIVGLLIQSVYVAYNPSYSPQRYQGTLFVFACALLQVLVNTIGASQLPRFQKVMMLPHGLGWIAVVIVLWVLAPHADAKDVFTNFSSNGGWEPIGISVMVGQITSVYFLILSDSAAHLAEEVKVAAESVPKAMIWSFMLNAIVGFIMLVSFLFCIPDVGTALDPETNPSGFVMLYVLMNASYKGCIPLIVMILVVALAGGIDSNCSTSRQMFAFARDGGLPGKAWLCKMNKDSIPWVSVVVTGIFTCILALINLGSSVAFNAIISLQLLALMSTYCVSIGCVLYQRIAHPGSLPVARWSLGKHGLWINAVGFVYSFFTLIWIAWPVSANPTTETFNWSSVMFVGVFVIALIFYYTTGKKSYAGPVVLVHKM